MGRIIGWLVPRGILIIIMGSRGRIGRDGRYH